MIIDVGAEDLQVLREHLGYYLVGFRRQVARTENPELRHDLERTQTVLERVAAQLDREVGRRTRPFRAAG